MGKASDWLREERRKVLGDWAAFCLDCGAVRRWFEEFEAVRFDQKIERDAKSGKLDRLAARALADFRSGRAREL